MNGLWSSKVLGCDMIIWTTKYSHKFEFEQRNALRKKGLYYDKNFAKRELNLYDPIIKDIKKFER